MDQNKRRYMAQHEPRVGSIKRDKDILHKSKKKRLYKKISLIKIVFS